MCTCSSPVPEPFYQEIWCCTNQCRPYGCAWFAIDWIDLTHCCSGCAVNFHGSFQLPFRVLGSKFKSNGMKSLFHGSKTSSHGNKLEVKWKQFKRSFTSTDAGHTSAWKCSWKLHGKKGNFHVSFHQLPSKHIAIFIECRDGCPTSMKLELLPSIEANMHEIFHQPSWRKGKSYSYFH